MSSPSDKDQLLLWPEEKATSTSQKSSEDREDQKFVGLSNQGATCYMNSLLQTLYMTPEFREKIYQWQYDQSKHGDPKDCIPFQLQLLFAKLQISKSAYIETTGLTKSFGWDLKESFQQHDVQEFCRVLFDAIEESVKETSQEKMINQLYEGTMVDYVKCLNCNQESSREDKYLDLSLTVKNDFDQIYNDSVEKALANYVKPDKLTDDNQYFCENCNGKQDALKGLKFASFPYILALQLKRFDLDYNTFQRIKLNDEVRFPQILNLNLFLLETPPNPSDYDLPQGQPTLKTETATPIPKPNLNTVPADIDQCDMQTVKLTGYDYIIEDSDKKPVKLDYVAQQIHFEKETQARNQKQQALINKYQSDGDNVYELFSILIHSGSALGGHYYAYIKDFEDNRWYNFNDSVVREIEEKDIQKVFGGVSKGSAWGGSYAANAYLLMYRKVQPNNIAKILDDQVPRYILEEIDRLKESEMKEAQEKMERYKNLQLRVYYETKEKIINVKKDDLFIEVKAKAKEIFGLDKVKDENIRVRAYSVHNDVLQDTYEESKTIEQLGIWSYKILGVEIKEEDEEWMPYDPNQMTIKILNWTDNMANEETGLNGLILNADKFLIDRRATVKQLIEKLSQKYNIPIENLKILKKPYMGHSSYAEVISTRSLWDQIMSQARLFEGTVLLIEKMENIMHKSKWQEELEKESGRYTIRFNHPDDKPNNYGNIDYKNSVVIDSSKTMSDLKSIICNKLKLNLDEVVLRRGTRSGAEIKDLNIKLIHCNLMNNSVIHVDKGKPSSANEYRIYISIAEPATGEDADGAAYRFYDALDSAFNGDCRVSSVKEEICKTLKKMYPTLELDSKRIRLRERTTDRLSRVLRNSEPLKNYSLFEQKKLAIQVLQEDEPELDPSSMIVVIKKWDPETWQVSEPKELVIKRTFNLHEFGTKISEEFGIPVSYT